VIHDLTHLLSFTEDVAVACIFVAAFTVIAWRNRRRKFLLYGWLGVLFIFAVGYVLIFAVMLH
jgi:hypothetical protein